MMKNKMHLLMLTMVILCTLLFRYMSFRFTILRSNFKNPGRLCASTMDCIAWAMNLRGRRFDPVGLLFNLTGPSGGPW